MAECVFCQRIKNGLYDRESAYAVAFEPLNPVTPGHLLVVPRIHMRDAAWSPSHAADSFVMAASIAQEITSGKYGVPGVNLITSIGAAATQTVFHMHIHVVPRREGDGLALPWTGQQRGDAQQPTEGDTNA